MHPHHLQRPGNDHEVVVLGTATSNVEVHAALAAQLSTGCVVLVKEMAYSITVCVALTLCSLKCNRVDLVHLADAVAPAVALCP
jgi:hypothetical protein